MDEQQIAETYYKVWHGLLTQVAGLTTEEFGSWMNRFGTRMLEVDPEYCFHEEAHFWVIPTIASKLQESLGLKVDGPSREIENKLFFLIQSMLSQRDVELSDWYAIRKRCEELIVEIR